MSTRRTGFSRLCKTFHNGKTYLACAFGNSACRQGVKVKYYRVNRRLTDLAVGRGDGSYNKLMREMKKTDLLEDRFEYRSIIISAQLPVKEWHALFEDIVSTD